MRCDHRYKLVGYRYRPIPPETTAVSDSGDLMDAVLVCLRCTKEELHGVSVIPPAPFIQAAPIGVMPDLENT